MTCARFENRLFDEDCRAALLRRDAVPADVTEHAEHCPACARQWAEAAADMRKLSEHLVVAPPLALRRDLYRAFRPRTRSRMPQIDTDTLSWAIAGGALGASLASALFALPGLSEWAGFCLGASLGLALAAMQDAGRAWLAPLTPVLRTTSRCIHRLTQVL